VPNRRAERARVATAACSRSRGGAVVTVVYPVRRACALAIGELEKAGLLLPSSFI
jgi:hypothetical protein